MKPTLQSSSKLREQIMRSAVASFRIEGIRISDQIAKNALRKVEAKLEKLSK